MTGVNSVSGIGQISNERCTVLSSVEEGYGRSIVNEECEYLY